MKFEELLIQINEVIHNSIQKYKEGIIGSGTYSDITISQLYYLEVIHNMDNPTLSELAKRLMITGASTSVGVQKLMRQGLVDRVQSDMDKRVFHISLTDKGQRLIEAEKEAFSGFAANIMDSLSNDEIKTLEKIFIKILKKYQ